MSQETVFISGATGFIAQHIIKSLLDSKFKVVGSFRNAEKAAKVKADFNNNPDLSLVMVEDISKLDAFDKVFQEEGAQFDYVLHTASPVDFYTTEFEKDLIIPAINGTKGIFQATVKYAPKVKKFIFTSSFAAIASSKLDPSEKITLTEKTWNESSLEESLSDAVSAYCYSKAAAEKCAWELHTSLNAKFALSAVHPTFVFGPQCFDSSVTETFSSASEFINTAIHSKLGDPLYPMVGYYIDVRDVAKVHLKCITNDELDGHRLILGEGIFTTQLVYDIINKEYPELNGKISKGQPETDEKANDPEEDNITLDDHVTRDLLKFQFKNFTEIVTDTADQIMKMDKK